MSGRPRRPSATTVGTYGVGLAAAVLSFDSLRGLAELVGFRGGLTWLFPLAVDLYAAVVARVWLGAGRHGKHVRRWARANTWLAICLSVAGNALYHALISGVGARLIKNEDGVVTEYDVNAVVVVAVSAVPPVVLGLVVHLRTLLTSDRDAETPAPAGVPSPEPALQVGVMPGGPGAVAVEPAVEPRAELPPARVATDEALSFADGAERKKYALAELARLADDGVDLSAAGFNQAMAARYQVSVSAVEKWKQDRQKQQAKAPAAVGAGG